jgi:ADP-heptose:LPS heptosyltransferase
LGLASDALKAIDAVLGRACCLLLAPLAARRAAADRGEPLSPRRVLVIRPGGIGDAVLLFPMLHAMREAWPGLRLEVLAEARNAGLFRANGVVDRVLRYDRLADLGEALRGGYDLVVDSEQTHYLSATVALLTRAPVRVGFATNRRRWLYTRRVAYSRQIYEAHSFMDLFRAASGRETRFDPDRPFFPLDEPFRDWAEEALASLPEGPLAVIHPGASTRLRRWRPSRYRRVAEALIERGLNVAVVGGPSDRRAAEEVCRDLPVGRTLDLAGRTDLARSAAVIARAALYVSADTGPLHLAYGLGVPTVHLFGPGELEKWAPAGARYRTVREPLPCSPCTRYGATPPCCQGVRCMEELKVEQVVGAIDEVLAS